MALWILFALLTALATVVVLRPYLRQRTSDDTPRSDLDIYRQQLQEIEGDRARGVLGEGEAHAAQIEISRRILALPQGMAASETVAKPMPAAAPFVMAGLMAAVAVGAYLIYGSPNLPDQPLAGRAQAPAPSLETITARVEQQLREHPDDGRGWGAIAMIYMRVGRYADAAKAYAKVNELFGESAEGLSNLGEALTFAGGETVTSEAHGLFEKALSLNGDDVKANFWLGVGDEQAGKFSDAAARYRKLVAADLPEELKAGIRERLAAVESRQNGVQQQEQAADENTMIDRMVARLAERVKTDGSNLADWLKLVRSYVVLGRREDALNTVKAAREKFVGNTNALSEIDTLVKTLGLTS